VRTSFGRAREGDVQSIGELWRGALSVGLHGAGCACTTGAIVLTAADLEEDLLDFLAARHSDDPILAGVFGARRKDRTTSFPVWMIGLQPTLDIAQWTALERDVRLVLDSATGASGSFLCS
jgi:hypothetical protein